MCYHIGLVFNLLKSHESSCKWYGFLIYMNEPNTEIYKTFDSIVYGVQAYMVTYDN